MHRYFTKTFFKLLTALLVILFIAIGVMVVVSGKPQGGVPVDNTAAQG